MMTKLKMTLVLLLVATVTFAQKSPRKQANGKIGEVNIDIDYGAPSVRERTIWGELVNYNKVWRAGANENTTISFDKDVTIENSTLPSGKYGFFIIPNENGEWVIILNKKNNSWGSNSYNKDEDILRLNIAPKFTDKSQEMLKFDIGEKEINFAWGKVRIIIPIN